MKISHLIAFLSPSAAVFLFVSIFCYSAPSISEIKQSVVLIDTEYEMEANPFLFFFFGSERRYNDAEFGLSPFGIQRGAPSTPQKVIAHAYGTGFFLNGVLITARHVVVPEEGRLRSITITSFDGKQAKAFLIRDDKGADLAMLDTRLVRPSLRLASRPPKVDDEIIEIGNPALIRFVVSKGTIVGFDREQGYNIASIDTFHGNSGGPDLNLKGEVIGLTHTLIEGSRFTGIGTYAQLRDFLYPDTIR